jgi:hypothetical protein
MNSFTIAGMWFAQQIERLDTGTQASGPMGLIRPRVFYPSPVHEFSMFFATFFQTEMYGLNSCLIHPVFPWFDIVCVKQKELVSAKHWHVVSAIVHEFLYIGSVGHELTICLQ